MDHDPEETMMTTHPTTPPSTDRPPDDPRLALLRALNTPPYDTAAGKTGASLCEAVQLIDDHCAVMLLEAAKTLERKFGVTPVTVELRLMSAKAQQSAPSTTDLPPGMLVVDRWIESMQILTGAANNPTPEQHEEMAAMRRRMLDVVRADALRDFLWRLEQSSGHDVAAKLIEDEPEWAELLSATEGTT